MDLGCILSPGPCIDAAVASWLAWFPFGVVGLAFTAGLVCGAALGKWGVAVVIALALALKVSGKADEPAEWQHPDPEPVKPKKRKTLLGK